MKHKWLLAVLAFTLVSAGVAGIYFAQHLSDKSQTPPPSPEECVKGLAEVKQLRADLARLGLEAFITNSALPQVAPHIHSQCWVDWLPEVEVERRAYEQEKREFGRDLAKRIEDCVLQDNIQVETRELEKRVHGLICLAEWLSTSHGYGNYLIKRWVEHVALNSVAVLITRSDCSLDTISGYVDRVAETDRNLPFRVDVLNEEAPHQFKLPMLNMSNDDGWLQAQWATRQQKTDRHYRELLKNGKIKAMTYSFAAVRNDNPEFAFYWDDGVGNATICESWDKKCHYWFCVGDMDRDCKADIKRLLLFREKVGLVPIPRQDELTNQSLSEAYRHKIDRMWNEKTGDRSILGVGHTLLAVYSGRPLDLESQNVKNKNLVTR